MWPRTTAIRIYFIALPLLASSACRDQKRAEGPMQRAGKSVDHAAQDTDAALRKAADKTGNALGTAAKKTGAAIEKVGKKLQGGDAK